MVVTTVKLTASICGSEWDLIADCVIELGEPEVSYYPDGSGHPGCGPDITIEMLKGRPVWLPEGMMMNITGLAQRCGTLEELEHTILEEYLD
ncbi:hypothetical protein V6R21_20405 [Limibacter armeniacum]|uniref:hypothetical protein n=1 Tax=Limibacter armeniacum TaxID=466084 RepID=UPI002FE53A4B